jgi:2-succinyl-6-hydroxy-2,4-cyclohexadiene-1-carboxylate synthase
VRLFLLHGFTGSASAWGEGVLGAMGRGGRLLPVDLPGHGDAARPTDPAEYRIERVVDHLVGILDGEGIDRADWVGYSLGGRVALAAAVLRPDRVRRLVLESASPGLETEAARARRRRDDEGLARRIEAKGIRWFVDYWMGLALFETQRELPPEVLATARRRRLGNDPAALAAALRGLGTGPQPSYWGDLAGIEAPTLLLTGALDRRFCRIAERMRGKMPSAVHRAVPDAGHAVHLEAPRTWVREVTTFLEE